ncbi:MAG: extracellular solute-binding protein [Treponema sp.]|jgi:raffinose/stachyose/melibiose transport system substrate-binding protein|nr:extracellular solute-binding protein [Treponema sp.]
MKHILKTAIGLLLAAVFCMTACKGKDSGSVSGGKPAEIPVVKLLVDKDSPFAGAQKVIDTIETKLGIKTEVEIRAGGVEGDNIMKTRLATGDMADVFWYNTGSKLQDLNPERNVYDITDEPFAANLSDAFKTAASSNGRLYAVPKNSTMAGAILYNRKVYQQLGLSVPHTWKDFLANCDKIQAAGKTALIGGFKDTWTSQLIILGDEYNVKSLMPNFPAEYTVNKAKYANTPVARRGFEKIEETRKYLNRDYLAATYDVALEMLVNGEGAHWPMLTQALTSIYTLYPDKIDDIGVFGIPGDDSNNHGLTVWVSDGLYIYKNTPNLDAAKKWVEFYISQEGISIFGSMEKPNGPYAIKGINLPDDSYTGVKEMQTYFDTGKVDVALEFESPVKGPNLEQICIEVASGNTSPTAAAAAYDADVQKQAVQLNLPGW